MAKVTVQGRVLKVQPGCLLSEALRPDHAPDMPCAGRGRCGKCRVHAVGALSDLTEAERAHLTKAESAHGVRLACCARVLGDCQVTLFTQAHSQIRMDGVMPAMQIDPIFTGFGAAIDIGTTTLAASLYARGGELLAQCSAPNPQSVWGADVISRVGAAISGQAQALARCIQDGIVALVNALCARAAIAPEAIDALVITGNTAMLTLLTHTDATCLSRAPFEATTLFGHTLTGRTLSLPCPEATVYLPRCMSAFVGADITTALLASGICAQQDTRMLADIGTNGEIALWHGGKLTCCSTAAGSAFEGAGLSMGMPGRAGAVDHVSVREGALCAHVLGDAPPQGICGSGVVDALACLLETGAMDETGLLEESPAMIAPGVGLTQKDVRMVQLAKSAVCAGLRTLLCTAGLAEQHVAELCVAGGFGSYLDVESAGRIGLIPPQMAARVRVLGNAALSGAAMLLLNRAFIGESERIAQSAQTVDLSQNAMFLQAYTEGMLFEQ